MNVLSELMKKTLLRHILGEPVSDDKHEKLIDIAELIVKRSNKVTSDSVALECIFNKINGHDMSLFYEYKLADNKIVYPSDKAVKPAFECKKCIDELSKYIDVTKPSDIGHIIEILEKYTSFLPASYFGDFGSEISYFDHIRMVCAIVSCLYEYQSEHGTEDISDYSSLKSKNCFLMYSFDTSGIQDFIYTITKEGALKGLRARSFYLEMIMETIVYELLEKTGLSKANLIYSGGGHSYILLPNTSKVKRLTDEFMEDLKKWLMKTFKAAVFVASGSCECSADSLSNIPKGSYRNIFRTISEEISKKKVHRYTASEILQLNVPLNQHERECKICHRSDRLNNDKCNICGCLEKTASQMMRSEYFAVWKNVSNNEDMLPLPFGLSLTAETIESLKKYSEKPVRVFVKNRLGDEHSDAVGIYVGDYASSSSFEELTKSSEGIKRLSVLRADVDNLGQAFVSGYSDEILTLSRTAAFSRLMSRFFKLYIKDILENGVYDLYGGHTPTNRNATIVYSGGDDLFIVGSWNDIIGLSVDLHNSFERFTQGTLSISAGIGMYHEKYPISAMARNSGELEDQSKDLDGKNAVTLFDDSNRYPWKEFIENVVGEKMQCLHAYMKYMNENSEKGDPSLHTKENSEKGNSFLHLMLSLIADMNDGDRLNIARFAYLLGRLRPEVKKSNDTVVNKKNEELKKIYQEFADNLYKWIQNKKDRRQLMTALRLYIYLTRKDEEEK